MIGPAKKRNRAITIGTFDGFHTGHQKLTDELIQQATIRGLEPLMVTFEPHPLAVIAPDRMPLQLTTPAEKRMLMERLFRGHVHVLRFDETMRQMSAEEFIRDLLIEELGAAYLLVGPDHAIGRNREGTAARLVELGNEHGLEVMMFPAYLLGSERVSSSRIRSLITDGRFDEALGLLGHPYPIGGSVERGIGLGRKLDIPTANLRPDPHKLLPAEGIYACTVTIDRAEKKGILFIGQNHFSPHVRITVEVHIFDFDRDLYGDRITIWPLAYIRENRTYATTEALVGQIAQDVKEALSILQQGERS